MRLLAPFLAVATILVGCNGSSMDPNYVASANAHFSSAERSISQSDLSAEQVRRLTQIYSDHPEYLVIFRNANLLHRLPRVRTMVPPKYPFFAALRNSRATVEVAFVVDEKGQVLDPRIYESTDSRFDDSALDSVGEWTFYPGTSGGELAKYVLIVPIQFAGTKW